MNANTRRSRLDALLVARGLAETHQRAQAMILAGEVYVDGNRIEKSGSATPTDAQIEINSRSQKYASRGGYKLEGALKDFGISPAGRVCLDIGWSSGGFTDCLLQNGATKVFAVDVNVHQLAWKLRKDSRIICIQRNARELRAEDIPEPADLVVADVSFIAVGKVLGPAARVAKRDGDFLILIKPQFELGRDEIGPGGIVMDPRLHEKAVFIVRDAARAAGLECIAVKASQLTGAEGNQEYFLHARRKPVE